MGKILTHCAVKKGTCIHANPKKAKYTYLEVCVFKKYRDVEIITIEEFKEREKLQKQND